MFCFRTTVEHQKKSAIACRDIRSGSGSDRVQPEGLADSSRWSERSVDHRIFTALGNPEGCKKRLWHPSGVRTNYSLLSGGLRFAPTTRLLSYSPPRLGESRHLRAFGRDEEQPLRTCLKRRVVSGAKSFGERETRSCQKVQQLLIGINALR
jgi:hypothetical protein